MSITWMLFFMGMFGVCAYTSWRAGFREGIVQTTNNVLMHLEDEGIIDISEEGEITSAYKGEAVDVKS